MNYIFTKTEYSTIRMIWLTLIAIIINRCTNCERIYDKIYTNLTSEHYCSRRLNATSQVGCTSNLGGNIGILWYIETEHDLSHVLSDGPTPPYMVAINREYFTRANILNFKSHRDRVAGVVFIVDNSKFTDIAFSPEDTCPNRNVGIYSNDSVYSNCRQNEWQESQVSGLLYDNIPFPIFLINHRESIQQINQCFSRNIIGGFNPQRDTSSIKTQATYPLCGIHLDSFMVAATNTERCMNSISFADMLMQSTRRRCTTVDANNIFGYFKTAKGPGMRIDKDRFKPGYPANNSVLLLTTKLSSISMFTNISPGGDSTITGIITLLAVANALNNVRMHVSRDDSKKNIAFLFFDSEPFDYTGSNRLAYDMYHGHFPYRFHSSSNNESEEFIQNIGLNSIDKIIDIGQLASYSDSSNMYIHFEPTFTKPDAQIKIMNTLQEKGKVNGINFLKASKEDSSKMPLPLPLPPSSIQSFLEYSRGNNDLGYSGAMISNFNTKFANKFYHSIFDDAKSLNRTKNLVEHLQKVSTSIAQAAFELAFPNSGNPEINVEAALIEQLIECYLRSANCPLFTEAYSAGHELPKGSIQTYYDPTKQSDDMNNVITKSMLAYFLGERIPTLNKTQCLHEDEQSTIYSYTFVNGKNNQEICIRSQVLRDLKNSASFSIEDEYIKVDSRYPAWTVSFSNIRNPVRIFILPNPLYDWLVFILGLTITAFSFITVYEVRRFIVKLVEDCEQPLSTTI